MDPTHKRFTSSTLAEAAGCNQVTFRDWRRRLGLFPETRTEQPGGEGWNQFSVLDICVVRFIVVLTSHGLPAADAVLAADFCRRRVQDLLNGEAIGSYIGFFRHPNSSIPLWINPADPEVTVSDFMSATVGAISIFDLRKIIHAVTSALRIRVGELAPSRRAKKVKRN